MATKPTPPPVDCPPADRIALGWSRRRWLTAGGVLAGSGVVAGVAWVLHDHQQRFGSPALERGTDHVVPRPSNAPGLVIARGKDPATNVRAVLDRLGGLQGFVQPGEVVLVKPNIGWDRTPEQAANTDPTVVAAVVQACREAKAGEILVSDCPVNDAERTFVRSGIQAAAAAAGARVLLPSTLAMEPAFLGPDLGNWPVFEPLLRADKVINVPVAKHHGSARVTAGMKNWFGITLHQRARFHAALDRTIVDLAAFVRPTLTLVDATRVLTRNGPAGGNLADVRTLNTVAASVDPVAIDAWATDLLGTPLADVRYLAIAAARGLGRLDYHDLGMVEIDT